MMDARQDGSYAIVFEGCLICCVMHQETARMKRGCQVVRSVMGAASRLVAPPRGLFSPPRQAPSSGC